MQVSYFFCDVFTDTRFGGNPLAVIPDARGLTAHQMQQIAREFNFSETTFVLPASAPYDREVRIFTPSREVPFAGHPNIGTAFVLSMIEDLVKPQQTAEMVFLEKAGPVRVTVQRGHDAFFATLAAPEPFQMIQTLPLPLVAKAVSLAPEQISTTRHAPVQASCGLAFIFAEVVSKDALAEARVNMDGFYALSELNIMPDIHLYTETTGQHDLQTRMFAPLDGVFEDPATGSANCALAGLLATHLSPQQGRQQWRIAQGVEMARPSTLLAYAEPSADGQIVTGVGGSAVMVASGSITV